MNLRELVTYSFSENVGRADRVFRVLSGLAAAGAGWLPRVPLWTSIAMTAAGLAWLLTGVVSRCGVYYLLGFTTCPIAHDEATATTPRPTDAKAQRRRS